MGLTYQEKLAIVRSETHTVVEERDDSYARFCRERTGVVRRLLRIWYVEGMDDRPISAGSRSQTTAFIAAFV